MTCTSYRDYVVRPVIDSLSPNALYFEHKDFDGAEDAGDYRYGYANSEDEARGLIDDQIADRAEHLRRRALLARTALRKALGEGEA